MEMGQPWVCKMLLQLKDRIAIYEMLIRQTVRPCGSKKAPQRRLLLVVYWFLDGLYYVFMHNSELIVLSTKDGVSLRYCRKKYWFFANCTHKTIHMFNNWCTVRIGKGYCSLFKLIILSTLEQSQLSSLRSIFYDVLRINILKESQCVHN